MKRVVDGKAYNTETAERIAVARETYEKGFREWISETVLYRTPKGAWFLVESEWPENDYGEREIRATFKALNGPESGESSPLDAAIAWVSRHQCDVVKPDYFPSFEDA